MTKKTIKNLINNEVIGAPADKKPTRLISQQIQKRKANISLPKQPRSVINNGVLEKFDERDLISKGTYTTPIGVTRIADLAFANCQKLKKIIIREEVTKIGIAAFSNCKNLQTVVLPTSLEKIKKSAFMNCSSLTQIQIPSKVKEIRDNVFGNCTNLQTVTLSNNTTTIGKDAFHHCFNLTSVLNAGAVTSIDSNAFLLLQTFAKCRIF